MAVIQDVDSRTKRYMARTFRVRKGMVFYCVRVF